MSNREIDDFEISGRVITRILGETYEGTGPPDSDSHLRAQVRQRARAVPDDTMDRVFAAARDLVVQHTFAGVRLEDIFVSAELSGDERAGIVSVFRDGGAIAAELMERTETPLVSDLSQVAIGDRDIVDGLVDVARRLAMRARRDPEYYLAVADFELRRRDHGNVPAVVSASRTAIQRNRQKMIAALIAQGQLTGAVRAGSPELLAASLSASLFGVVFMSLNSAFTAALGVYGAELANTSLDLLAAGLRPEPKG